MLERIGLVASSSFDENTLSLTATFDSYHPDYFAGTAVGDDGEDDTRAKTITVTMFQRVVVVGRIKTEKRELDMGLRLVIDSTGVKTKASPQLVLHVDETCDGMNARGD